MLRTRHDIATVTLGDVADAETQERHPVHFRPWRRAHLALYEGTIRQLTGKGGWGLPTRFVDGGTVPNPLFDPTRHQTPARLPAGRPWRSGFPAGPGPWGRTSGGRNE